jgi:hypothetical protein
MSVTSVLGLTGRYERGASRCLAPRRLECCGDTSAVYRVGRSPAVAAVLIYEAAGLLVPLIGGAVAYLLLRREFRPMRTVRGAGDGPDEGAGHPGNDKADERTGHPGTTSITVR